MTSLTKQRGPLARPPSSRQMTFKGHSKCDARCKAIDFYTIYVIKKKANQTFLCPIQT